MKVRDIIWANCWATYCWGRAAGSRLHLKFRRQFAVKLHSCTLCPIQRAPLSRCWVLLVGSFVFSLVPSLEESLFPWPSNDDYLTSRSSWEEFRAYTGSSPIEVLSENLWQVWNVAHRPLIQAYRRAISLSQRSSDWRPLVIEWNWVNRFKVTIWSEDGVLWLQSSGRLPCTERILASDFRCSNWLWLASEFHQWKLCKWNVRLLKILHWRTLADAAAGH